MRICLVSREFAPYYGAGIGTYAAQMAAAWASAGHEVHILTGQHRGLLEAVPALQPAIRFHTVRPAPTRTGLGRVRPDFEAYSLGAREALRRLHAMAPLDYIEFPDYWAEGSAALRARRARGEFGGAILGVRLHTPTRICRRLNGEPDDPAAAVLQEAEEWAIRAADAVVSPTRSLLDMVEAELRPLPRIRRVVSYPFSTGAAAELLAGPAREEGAGAAPTVLYFGRLEHRKGVHLLIEAATTLLDRGVDAGFRFIGGDTRTGPGVGSCRQWLEGGIAPRHRARFVFEGPRPRSELGWAIRGAAACCFPSLWENFPNACLEAMALGAAVVGSDAGGMASIIRDGEDGLLFPAGNAPALGAAIERLLRDPELRARVGAAAPARIAAICDPIRVVREMEEVIAEARRESASSARPGGVRSALSALAGTLMRR